MGGRGKALLIAFKYFAFAFPSKKSSLQKIFGSNLHLDARIARGTPKSPWDSLLAGKETHGDFDLSSKLLTLYHIARTHFSKHDDE